jgi:hypothetical protein
MPLSPDKAGGPILKEFSSHGSYAIEHIPKTEKTLGFEVVMRMTTKSPGIDHCIA